MRAKRPKLGSRKKSPDLETLFYGALCLALLGLVAWRLWVFKHAQEAAPPAKQPVTNNAPIAKPTPQPIVTRAPIPAEGRPVQNVFEAQVVLAREGISCGSIDGVAGSQTRSAFLAFQKKRGLPLTGVLDQETRDALLLDAPTTTEYTVTAEDLARLLPIGTTWQAKSEQPRLDYPNLLELLGEKSFSHPQFIRALNPQIDWSNVPIGAQVILPNVSYPPAASKAATITIYLEQRLLEAFDDNGALLVHFPCSIGRLAEKRPTGELHVANIALGPNYTFDPDVFPESEEAQEIGHKLILPPGPRNPVGMAWIGLDRPGYGIHGTPAPEKVGRTESHGCFRLANWNAEYLAKLVWVGMPVTIE